MAIWLSSFRWISLILDFLDFDSSFFWWVGEVCDLLPFVIGSILGDDGFEELVQVMCKSTFEELRSELEQRLVKSIVTRMGDKRCLQHSLLSASPQRNT
jgi:hypothetical protein